ncbi:hypothetical protein WBU86_05260 [Escherichia coli]|uniref:hypothetical protein n=1 Tax=Escherichia coli TaxID=562 RepID=UPI000AF564E2|nr:hypothetical protein [Escherichia coli]BDY93873.1 hypothetical protein MUTS15_25300 [Escherichia coli]BDZ02470.1 hypothetical protein MUTS16_35430 [Escherichia coli]
MDTDSYWPGDMPQCGAALAALLMHITTQWLWEKLKAAYSLKELSDAVRAWKRQKNTGDTEQ